MIHTLASVKTNNRIAALFIGLEVIAVLIPVIVLGKYFEFPDVLRRPAAYGLTLFRQHQAQIVPAYYVFMLSGLLFFPVSYSLSAALRTNTRSTLHQAFIGTGLATAIFQAIGFSRWLFVVPFMAEQFVQQPAQKQTIIWLYETLNRYIGMTIGEHLGFLAMGCWTVLLASLLWQYSSLKKWFVAMGFLIGLGLIGSIPEHFGGSLAEMYGTINFVANTLWSVWMFGLGIWLIFGHQPVDMPVVSNILH
jgi:hypothetical protein